MLKNLNVVLLSSQPINTLWNALIQEALLDTSDKLTIFLVERVSDLAKLQNEYLKRHRPTSDLSAIFELLKNERKCTFIEGQGMMLEEWTRISPKSNIVFTTTISLLHALLHGFIGLQQVYRLIGLGEVPTYANQHPWCSIMQLFYWPALARAFYAGADGMVPILTFLARVEPRFTSGKCNNSDSNKSSNDISTNNGNEDIFKRHEWMARVHHYWQFFDSVAEFVDGTVCDLPIKFNEGNILSFLKFHIGQVDGSIDARTQDPVELASQLCASPAPTEICNATPLFIAQLVNAYLAKSRSFTVNDPVQERQLDSVDYRFQRMANEPMLLDTSDRHVRMPSGALIEPKMAISLLLSFCAMLPKSTGGGKNVKNLSIRTVPVRRLDASGMQIIDADDPDMSRQYFVCKVILPECLSPYLALTVVGPAVSNRHGAQSEAAFKAMRLLHDRGLLSSHLFPIDSLLHLSGTDGDTSASSSDACGSSSHASSMQEHPSNGRQLDGALCDLEFKSDHLLTENEVSDESDQDLIEIVADEPGAESSLSMDEIIPPLLQSSSDWKAFYVYALEYSLFGDSLPFLSKWLSIYGPFLSTKTGPVTFGFAFKDKLPGSLPDIVVPLGADAKLSCSIKYVGELCSEDYEKLLLLQPLLFGILNVRPLFLEELLNGDASRLSSMNVPEEKKRMYLIAPLRREGFEYPEMEITHLLKSFKSCSHEPVDHSGRPWQLDMSIGQALTGGDQNLAGLLDRLSRVKDQLSEEEFCDFRDAVIKQCLLYTPYNGMFYRYRKLYPQLTPSSPFESKSCPEARTYWEYVKLRYQAQCDQDFSDEAPLCGVSRIESFADLARWCNDGDDIVPGRKKLKRDRLLSGKDDHKTALIPHLTMISRVPYGFVRILLVIPRVITDLERQLLCLGLYDKLLSDGYLPIEVASTVPSNHALIHSLTTSTAQQPFNYERLEVLGDSILKVAVSLDIFSRYGSLGEGRLSQLRQARISNANLHRIGKSIHIHRYLFTAPFIPKLWCPPSLTMLGIPLDRRASPKDQLDWAQRQRIFDPELYWRVIDEVEKRREGRVRVFDFHVATNQLILKDPPKNHPTELKRFGEELAAKTIADVVEASVAAIFITHGWTGCIYYLRRLGLIEGNLMEYYSRNPIETLGCLRGDPRDRVSVKPALSTVDWSKPLLCAPSSYGADGLFGHPGHLTVCREADFKYGEIEAILKYSFKNQKLLFAAFTHSSVDSIYCNERLEWLGDAIIDWLATHYYFNHAIGREMNPFELTEARKATVNNAAFSRVTVRNGLHKHLRCLNEDVVKDMQHYADYVVHDDAKKHSEDPPPPAPKTLGDIFEAVIGAIFLDMSCSIDSLDHLSSITMALLSDLISANPDDIPVSAVSRCLEAYARLGITEVSIQFTADAENVRGRCRVLMRGTRVVGEAVVGVVGSGVKARAVAKEAAAQKALDFLINNGIHGL